MLAAGAARDEPQVERVVLRIQASQAPPPHTAAADVDLRFVGTPRVGVATSADGRDYRLGYDLMVAQGAALRDLDRPGSVQSRICGNCSGGMPRRHQRPRSPRDAHPARLSPGGGAPRQSASTPWRNRVLRPGTMRRRSVCTRSRSADHIDLSQTTVYDTG